MSRPHSRISRYSKQVIASGVSGNVGVVRQFAKASTPSDSGVAIITITHEPVNSYNPSVGADIEFCYDALITNPKVKAIVITGKPGFFMAGADIAHIANMQKSGVEKSQVTEFLESTNAFFNRMESGSKPIVAAVDGIAFGGGCELAMACNGIVCSSRSTFGLPELSLGIIPGFGGTQRLPRLIGVPAAVDATLKSKSFSATKAKKLGLVDELVSGDVIAAASQLALDMASGKKGIRMTLQSDVKIGPIQQGLAVVRAARSQIQKNRKLSFLPHPVAFLDAVEAGIQHGGEKGLQKEMDIMSDLILSPSASSLIHIFLAQKETSKVPGVRLEKSNIRTVAVLGGGTMGSGIAALYIMRGFKVILKEINQKALDAGVKRVTKVVERFAKKKKLSPEATAAILNRMQGALTYDDFGKCDLVIEAAVENIKIKQRIFRDLENACSKSCILATNTSTINIDTVGALTNAKDRILGLHFFSPAHVMPLLEIVRTPSTSAIVLGQCLSMCKKIGKTGVVVGNCVGFTANRIFFPYGQSAAFLVDHGVDPYRVDKALLNFGMPMGCFQMSDLSGIDIFLYVGGIIDSAYGERCYHTSLGKILADKGRLGQKTGAGYYNYKSGRMQPDPELKELVRESRIASGNPPNISGSVSEEDLVEMVLFPVVNESLRVVDEGHVIRKGDVDLVSIMGYGFPAHRGGILHWAEHGVGFKKVYNRLKEFSEAYGANNPKAKAFFAPCDLLTKLGSR